MVMKLEQWTGEKDGQGEDHTPSIAFRHLPPGCRKAVLAGWARTSAKPVRLSATWIC